jgi:AbiTii
MTSLVLELRHEAMDPRVRVDDLLQKAVVVATKLSIDDFQVWAAQELQGYAGDTTTPAYRQVTGVLKAHSPGRGWIPVILPDQDRRGLNQEPLESRSASLRIYTTILIRATRFQWDRMPGSAA